MNIKNTTYRRKSVPERQREIIQAGKNCLGRGGISAFTIDQICKEAGVSRGLINHHFNTKEELLIRIYADMTEPLIRDRSWETPQQQLAAIIDISFDRHSSNKSNLRAWLSIWGEVPTNSELSKWYQSRYETYEAKIESSLLEIAAIDGLKIDGKSIARQLIALIDGLWLEYCLHSKAISLATAKSDCYRLLQSYGVTL